MVKTLLKKQFAEIFRNYFYDMKKNKARSKLGTVAYILFFVLIMVGMLGGMFSAMALTLCAPLCAAGAGWLYFAITGLISILLGVFGSVFSTYTGLYLAKDNDLLLSMPIPTQSIMLARLLGVYLMGLLYAAVVIVPAVVVYLTVVPFSGAALFGCFMLILLISVFVLTLSCLLGWVVARLSLKLKSKSLVTVLISLVLIGLYYFFYFKAMDLIRDLLANIAVYGPAIREKAYGLYVFGSVGTGDLLSVAICTAAVAALFALMWRLLGRSFLSLATATGRAERVKYTARREKQRSIPAALLKKEFARLGSSANYILNCCLGSLFIPVVGILLLIRGRFLIDALSEVFVELNGAVTVILCTALCIASSINDCAAPSVSLEGKNIWIAQSLPVEPWQILRAKLRVQLVLTMPALLFSSLCGVLAAKAPFAESLALIVLPQFSALFFALLGLTLDLRHANLAWTNELAPIKQSLPVAVALLGSMGYSILLAGGFLLLTPSGGAALYLWSFAAVTGGAALALYLWLRRKGGQVFLDL